MAEHLRAFESFTALVAALDSVRLAWGRVREVGEDTYAQPSVASRGVLVEVEDNVGEKRRVVQSPYKFSNADSGIQPSSRAADIGADNESALRDWLGWDADRVNALRKSGVLLNPASASR